MSDSLPVLYIKSGCPWCAEVIAFLSEHGVGYRQQNVSVDPAALAEMRRVSGQGKAPVLNWKGTILADFGVDELIPFLRDHNVKFEAS